ncbi:hypothetical protein QJQ45_018653, partial [Haematococcus lacustris]
MLISKKSRREVYKYLFKEGVLQAEKDYNKAKHSDELDIPNLQVIKMMQSFTSLELVTERFAWRHYYWFLTDKGIEYLREYLGLPQDVVPATLKKSQNKAKMHTSGLTGLWSACQHALVATGLAVPAASGIAREVVASVGAMAATALGLARADSGVALAARIRLALLAPTSLGSVAASAVELLLPRPRHVPSDRACPKLEGSFHAWGLLAHLCDTSHMFRFAAHLQNNIRGRIVAVQATHRTSMNSTVSYDAWQNELRSLALEQQYTHFLSRVNSLLCREGVPFRTLQRGLVSALLEVTAARPFLAACLWELVTSPAGNQPPTTLHLTSGHPQQLAKGVAAAAAQQPCSSPSASDACAYSSALPYLLLDCVPAVPHEQQPSACAPALASPLEPQQPCKPQNPNAYPMPPSDPDPNPDPSPSPSLGPTPHSAVGPATARCHSEAGHSASNSLDRQIGMAMGVGAQQAGAPPPCLPLVLRLLLHACAQRSVKLVTRLAAAFDVCSDTLSTLAGSESPHGLQQQRARPAAGWTSAAGQPGPAEQLVQQQQQQQAPAQQQSAQQQRQQEVQQPSMWQQQVQEVPWQQQ